MKSREVDKVHMEHRFKMRGEKCKGFSGDRFFTQRVVTMWNELPEEVLGADIITMFNSLLEGAWIGKQFSIPAQCVEMRLV